MKKILIGSILLLFFFSCKEKTDSKNASASLNYRVINSLFDDNVIHELKISFMYKDFWDSIVHVKKLRDSMEVSRYLLCDIKLDNKLLDSCGIRAKGESSFEFYPSNKKSFKIKFNHFVKNQNYKGYRKISLNNNFKDPTMMREKLMLDFIRRVGLPAPKSSYVKVYINEKYWGLYLMVEEIDTRFLKENFTKDSIGNLYKGEPFPTFNYEGTDTENYFRKYMKQTREKENDWNDLIILTRNINANHSSDSAYKQNLDKLLNIDPLLKIWAINNLFVNIDAYNMLFNHNFYIYNDPVTKKFHWINYDYNYGFAAWNPKYKLKDILNFNILYLPQPLRDYPLAHMLLEENKIYRQRYLEIMQDLITKSFDESIMKKEITKHQELIKDAVKDDNLKMFTYEEFETNVDKTIGDPNDPGAFIPGLNEFVRVRKENVLKQLKQQQIAIR